MKENHYICVVRDAEYEYTVSVFSKKEFSKQNREELDELKTLAIDEVVQSRKKFGIDIDKESLFFIGFNKLEQFILS